MRPIVLALIALCVALPVQAAETMCNIRVDANDDEANSVVVRAAPGGKAIATLVDKADWIELHVVGQSGDWFTVDRAYQIDNARMGQTIVLWSGRGYVTKSTVGLSGLQQGARMFFDHDLESRIVVRNANGDQSTQVLGCWNDFYYVKASRDVGWTKQVCTNQNTTCS